MKKTALFSYIKTNFLSGINPQVLYFLFYILLINFAVCIAGLLGFMSASNFVFLYVIAVLVVRDFTISLRLAMQEERLNSLVQAAALNWNSTDLKSSNDGQS